MRRYEPLYTFLSSVKETKVTLSYLQIEEILSNKLPESAYKYKEWWDNNSHIQSDSWRTASFIVCDVVLGEKVTFQKG